MSEPAQGQAADAGPSGKRKRRRNRRREPEEAVIEDFSHDGRGVTHIDGKTVFVIGALAGERVRQQRMKRRRSHDEAMLLEVLEPSEERIEPRCAVFGICGGCSLQHLASERQIEIKQGVLLDNMQRIGDLEVENVLPPLTAEPWAYRRRARLAVRNVPAKGRVLVGFREKMKPIVVDMHACEVLAAQVGYLLDDLSQMIGSLAISDRVPQIEVAVADHAIALVFRVLDPPAAPDLALLHAFGEAHNIDIYLQPGGPDTIAPLGEVRELTYALPAFDVTLRFLPTDFVQVNGALNERMVSRAIELMEIRPDDHVLDLFCGLGNFTLPLARRAGQVTGVEGAASLIERARQNAEANGISNVDYHVADLAESLDDLPWVRQAYDLLLLDPPRTGAREVLPYLKHWQPRRICYVSCHPGTLARDAGELVQQHGYKLISAGVMDMFPHTAHVESIALFERKGA